MRTIINQTQVPNGGWRYEVPETRTLIATSNFSGLFTSVRQHYKTNNIPIPDDIEARIEDWLCSQIEPELCSYPETAGNNNYPRLITMEDFKRGTATLVNFLVTGRKKVDRRTANERAAICVSCPQNRLPAGCSACNASAIHKLVNAVTGADKTDHDDQLRACSVCACSIKAKVWFPKDLLVKHTPESLNAKLPAWCWAKV